MFSHDAFCCFSLKAMGRFGRVVVFLLTGIVTAIPVGADSEPAQRATRPASTVAASVADGAPWKVTMDSGKKIVMTLFPDGTGHSEGSFLGSAPTWRPTPDGMCVRFSIILPETCVALVVRPGGYDALKEGRVFYSLRR